MESAAPVTISEARIERAADSGWGNRAKIVARAVMRAMHPGMADSGFNKTWDISGPEWRATYLEGVVNGFKEAGIASDKSHHADAPEIAAAERRGKMEGMRAAFDACLTAESGADARAAIDARIAAIQAEEKAAP